MYTTEAQARNKQCCGPPMMLIAVRLQMAAQGHKVQVFHSNEAEPTEMASYTVNSCCVGSGCMAWRWVTQDEPRHGYCGLAPRAGFEA